MPRANTQESTQKATPPKGYRDESTQYYESEGFVQAAPGVVVHGELLSVYKAGKGDVFALRLIDPCLSVKVEGGEIVPMDAGSTVTCNMTVRLGNVAAYEKGAKVWFQYLGKTGIPNGNEVWEMEGPHIDGKRSQDVPF